VNYPDITSMVLAERRRDQRREAEGARLAAIVRCCRPSALASVARRLGDALSRSSREPAACSC
jgi:hypothetical protein